MRINILTENGSMGGISFNAPLKRSAKAFKERKVSFAFLSDPMDGKLIDCDCLFINSKVFRTWWSAESKDRLLERFAHFRRRVGKVCYFDTTDSSGTLQAELLPLVTSYSKCFLLKDRQAYLKTFYGGRIFTDFYHGAFGVTDREEITPELRKPIDERDLGKLRVSWNPALTFGNDGWTRLRFLFADRFTPPESPRPHELTCRMTVNHQRETIRFQRERVADLLRGRGVDVGKLGKREYFREMRESRIGVSPFGWGEFAFRDFEIFRHGCVLLKPDVSHMETWPDVYRKGETYAGFAWDFRDFEEVVSGLLSDREAALRIARNGQAAYRWCLESPEARIQFRDRVMELVETA